MAAGCGIPALAQSWIGQEGFVLQTAVVVWLAIFRMRIAVLFSLAPACHHLASVQCGKPGRSGATHHWTARHGVHHHGQLIGSRCSGA